MALAAEMALVRTQATGLCVYCCRETIWIEPFTGVAACNVEHLAKATAQDRREPAVVERGRRNRQR